MHDSQVANDLIEVIQEAQYFIADKGYDSQEIRDKAIEHGMKAIIPKRKNAKQPNPDFDSYLYKLRHLVENAFARLKQFRSIATRYEKLARNFKSMLYLACSIIHAKLNWGHALIHDEKKNKVLAILNGGNEIDDDIQSLIDNRWQGLLEDDRSWKSVF